MNTIDLILLVAAFVLTFTSAFWNPPGRPHLGWLGVALGILSLLPLP
jgi:hypothetical protein